MKTALIYSGQLKDYDFGPGHPFRSDRFDSFLRLYEEKLGKNENFELVRNEKLALDRELELWHTKDYIRGLEAASAGLALPGLSALVSPDNLSPLSGEFPRGIEKAARAVVKNSLLALDSVQEGKSEKALSVGGGLHHAKANYGEGFCIYNDVAIAGKYALREHDLERVLILDTDAHAGNGTAEAFYSEPRVLFIDLHQEGIYPGTGFLEEIGEGKGEGFTVNLPLAAGTGDRSYELLFKEIIIPLAREYRPEIIIRNGGSDPHPRDGITNLGLSLAGFKMIGERVREMSKICDNKSVDLICSGYNPEVLAPAWLSLIAGLSGAEIELPEPDPRAEEGRSLERTKDLIKKVKKNLSPYWKSLKK